MTREPGTLADPAVDRITVDGRAVPAREAPQYLLLHKPAGVVTSVRDPQGRPVVTDGGLEPDLIYHHDVDLWTT